MAQNKAFSLGGVGSPCCCGGAATLPCSPCAIPKQNLTISWVNPLFGNSSDTLVYTAGVGWSTGCSGGSGSGNQLIFKFSCTISTIELRVYFFLSGSCPIGESAYCSNLLPAGSKLILVSYTCGSGFSMTFHTYPDSTGCPELSGSGFTSFVVTL